MHGAEVKTAIVLWIAGGSFVAGVAARPLLRWTPLMVAAPTES